MKPKNVHTEETTPDISTEFPLPRLKLPSKYTHNIEAHKKWLQLVNHAELAVKEDADIQKAAETRGYRIKGRALPPEVLGRCYARYCDLINNMYDAYLNNVQLQRVEFMKEIIALLIKRMYELRNELVHIIVNDYIYVDIALTQLRKTPFDIQIVVPYHLPLEAREETMEGMLQQMWKEAAVRRKLPIKQQPTPSTRPDYDVLFGHGSEAHLFGGVPASERFEEEVFDDEESECNKYFNVSDIDCIVGVRVMFCTHLYQPDYVLLNMGLLLKSLALSVHTHIAAHYIQIVTIQKQERKRQWFMADFNLRCKKRRTYFAEKLIEAPTEMKDKAAKIIQRLYREFMTIKRLKIQDLHRDILLGITPDHFRKPIADYKQENDKVYERRSQLREKLKEQYQRDFEREKTRVIVYKKNDQIDDITQHVRLWFREWLYGYGFFPQFPYELEGGTVLVIREDYPYIEEKQAEDERTAQLNKGKTKEMLKQEKERAKQEAELKAEMHRIAEKKEAQNLLKARCSPQSDPGHKPYSSETTENLVKILQQYRAAWSIYDAIPPEVFGETVYGYLKPLITEEIMCQLHKDCRIFVDEMARLDLKLLIKLQQKMFNRLGWKFPKTKPRQKPPQPFIMKEFVVDQQLLKKIEPVFDARIITKPTTKFADIYGDLNFAAYDLNIRDPDAKFPPPGFGDVKRRIFLSCVFGSGLQQGAPKRKAIMFLGPGKNGKTLLADAVAGEMNAVKLDITPEVFSAKVKKPIRVLHQVMLTAGAFQPAVIFMKNVERVFAKKVSPEDRHLRATSLKRSLIKLVKGISAEDNVIFIGTCTDTVGIHRKPMVSLFDEIILVPRTDYASVRQFFYDKLNSIQSMPREYPVQPLAQLLQGYGFGTLVEAFNEVMSSERIIRLNIEPLDPMEFLNYLIDKGEEPLTIQEYNETYVNFYIENSPLRVERQDYEHINMIRAEFYKAMAKKEQANKEQKNE